MSTTAGRVVAFIAFLLELVGDVRATLGRGRCARHRGYPSAAARGTLDRASSSWRMMPSVEDGTAAAFGLFGREDDLRILSDVLDGGGSAIAIGDPGVGKSSLLKVADQLAQRRRPTGAFRHSDAVRPRTALRGAGRADRPVSRRSRQSPSGTATARSRGRLAACRTRRTRGRRLGSTAGRPRTADAPLRVRAGRAHHRRPAVAGPGQRSAASASHSAASRSNLTG